MHFLSLWEAKVAKVLKLSHTGQFGPPTETADWFAGQISCQWEEMWRGNRETEVVSGKQTEVSLSGQFQFQIDLIHSPKVTIVTAWDSTKLWPVFAPGLMLIKALVGWQFLRIFHFIYILFFFFWSDYQKDKCARKSMEYLCDFPIWDPKLSLKALNKALITCTWSLSV